MNIDSTMVNNMNSKEKYHTNEEYRKSVIAAIKKYQSTEKGKLSLQKARAKKDPEYIKIYCKNRRMEAFKEGICQRCFKEKVKGRYTMCEACLSKAREYHSRGSK